MFFCSNEPGGCKTYSPVSGTQFVRIASGAYRRPSPARSGTDGGGGDRAMAARSQRGTLGAMPAAPISLSRPPSATGRKSRRSSASLVSGG